MVKIFLEFPILPFGYLREWPKPYLVVRISYLVFRQDDGIDSR